MLTMNVNSVNLITTTPINMHSIEYIHSTPDGDNLVAYMARVSNPKNQNNTSTAPKLIKYLINHKHWSPFEMVSMCIKINTHALLHPKFLDIDHSLFKSSLNVMQK